MAENPKNSMSDVVLTINVDKISDYFVIQYSVGGVNIKGSAPAKLAVKEVHDRRKALLEALERFKKRKSIKNLRGLAIHGRDFYEYLCNSFHEPRDEERLRSLLNTSVHSASEARLPPTTLVQVRYDNSRDFIPFSLLYLQKPTNLFEKDDSSIQGFLGAKCVVIQSLSHNDDKIRCRLKEANGRLKVLFSGDEDVEGVTGEQAVLRGRSEVDDIVAFPKSEFFKMWIGTRPGIVHLSAHHRIDDHGKAYLTFGPSGSKQSVHSFDDRGSLSSLRDSGFPLVFLHCCSTGVLDSNQLTAFVEILCPKSAVGILATVYRVRSQDAIEFTTVFYEKLLEVDRRYFKDALMLTKREMISKGNFGGICYEFWEIPEILST